LPMRGTVVGPGEQRGTCRPRRATRDHVRNREWAMPGPVTREEFDELVEEVRGEKVVTRHILEETRRNSDDLAVLKTRVQRVEEKVDGLDRKVDGLERKVDGLDRKVDLLDRKVDLLDRKVDGLAREIPRIVADTMREVMREERERK